MPRKTTLLIIILAVITAILVYLAVMSDKSQDVIDSNAPPLTVSPSVPSVAPYATLSFTTPTLDLTKTTTATHSVEIALNTNGKDAFGAQIELSYDPKVLYNVSIAKASDSFFGSDAPILIDTVDPTSGRISFATAFGANDSGKSGSGNVAVITFGVNKYVGMSSTAINFLSKTTVTSLKTSKSVLRQTTPLNIVLTSSTTQGNANTATPITNTP